MVHYSENLPIKYHDQNFCIKNSQDNIEEFSFLANLIKISISLLKLGTKSAEKLIIQDILFSIAIIYSSKMTINLPLK